MAALVLFAEAPKFEDALESMSVEVVSDSQLDRAPKGEKTAKDVKPLPRAEKVADKTDIKPPPTREAKKDVPAPPPPLKRNADPGEDDAPPTPPRRVAVAAPPPPPPRPELAKPEPRPVPVPPAKPVAKPAPEPEKEEPDEAEVVKPKPPVRPKDMPKETPKEVAKAIAKEAPKEPPPKPPEKPKPEKPVEKLNPDLLKIDEVAKILEQKRAEEGAPDAKAEKSTKASKPKSGDESAPKSKFSASNIANLLSREAPQQQASTGRERQQVAALGAADGHAEKPSASMQARIASYIIDHYRPCWAAGLSLGARSYQPVVEFHLTREGALIGAPHLLNPASEATDRARAEQALQAVRKCSPIHMPAEFAPYYDFWRDTKLRMTEEM